jgi:L-ascorbate metabolism protein UlaG (beta-lactamase superfamily)
MRFMLDGVRVCHLGDLGQAALRDEQVAALGVVDLLFVPVGGGPTLDAAGAAAAVERLAPRWVVPMHYRTAAIDFLEPADAFLASFGERVVRCTSPSFDTAQLDTAGEPVAVVPAIPT